MFTEDEKAYFMKEALKEAKKAEEIAEVPIGAVIVKNHKVIARGYNQRETSNRAISHAEILAIEEANAALDNWRLEDCALFVTVEPCVMCSGAIVQSRIPTVYYGASDYKGGTAGISYTRCLGSRLGNLVRWYGNNPVHLFSAMR